MRTTYLESKMHQQYRKYKQQGENNNMYLQAVHHQSEVGLNFASSRQLDKNYATQQ